METALKAFREVLAKNEDNNVLVLLQEAGWREEMPSESHLSFTHPAYPGVVVELRFAPLRARVA